MTTAARQTFQGGDDLLLLARVAQSPPWRQRGVMDAWQQIAQALNADAGCSLSTLSGAATRARFFRLVAQRRAGQDKMLRRGASDEAQFQRKLELLDALIARMDADEEVTSLHHLLRDVDVEDDAGHALPLPVSSPYVARTGPPQPVASQAFVPQHTQRHHTAPPATSRPQVQVQRPPVSLRNAAPRKPTSHVAHASAPTASRSVPLAPPQYRPVQTPLVAQRLPPAATIVVPIDSPETDRRNGARPRPAAAATPPAKRQATGQKAVPAVSDQVVISGGGQGWENIIGRALEFMQRKLDADREAAEADRAWRREEARARQDEMKTMREQTDRLIRAVLELAQAKS